MEKCVDAPSIELFDSLTKDRLQELASEYELDMQVQLKNGRIPLNLLRKALIQKRILLIEKSPPSSASSLTFEQQRELGYSNYNWSLKNWTTRLF